MAYTKQELIHAFCEARKCNVSDLPLIEAQIQRAIDRSREALQARLDAMPVTARQQMKRVAIEHLNKKSAIQTIADNEGVTL